MTDMGGPGPDRGQGGKNLILPPGLTAMFPPGTSPRVLRATSASWRSAGFQVDGRPDAASRMFREGVRIYPLDRRDDPPAMGFINGSTQSFNTIHADNAECYDELHTVIDREPVEIIDAETRGLLASTGIRKGERFGQDERLRNILVESAAVGNATARALFFGTDDPENQLYAGSYWKHGFIGGNHEFPFDGGGGKRNLDARTTFLYMATLTTPAMAAKMIGIGS